MRQTTPGNSSDDKLAYEEKIRKQIMKNQEKSNNNSNIILLFLQTVKQFRQ
jgi:hypothetical protein